MKFLKYFKTMLYGLIALVLAILSVTAQSLATSFVLVLTSIFSIWAYGKKVDKLKMAE